MDELDVIQKLGVATSPEVFVILGKNHISTIRQLESWEKVGEIKVIELKIRGYCKRRLYMTNELHKSIFQD